MSQLMVSVLASFTEVHEEERVSSEKLQKLGWSFRPLKESLIDSVENYRKAGLIDWKHWIVIFSFPTKYRFHKGNSYGLI